MADVTAVDPMTVPAVLKQLILELIYPAVLGAVLYLALDFGSAVADTVTRKLIAPGPIAFNLALKCNLLAATLLFYGCDYTYTMLTPTENFETKFFWYDCFSLVSLYGTILRIHIKTSELYRPPQVRSIAILFCAFFLFYFWWDRFEYARTSAHEQQLFGKVMWWEALSLLCFAGVVVTATIAPSNNFVEGFFGIALTASAVCFFLLVRKKRQFSKA